VKPAPHKFDRILGTPESFLVEKFLRYRIWLRSAYTRVNILRRKAKNSGVVSNVRNEHRVYYTPVNGCICSINQNQAK